MNKIIYPDTPLYPGVQELEISVSGDTTISNYPIWWEDTITLYNKYEDKQTNLITW